MDKEGSYEHLLNRAPITKSPYRSTSGRGGQRIDIVKIYNIIITGTIVDNGSVGGAVGFVDLWGVRYRWAIFDLARAVLDIKSTTGDICGSSRGECREDGEEEEDGDGKSGDGARHLGECSWGWVAGDKNPL